MRDEGRGGVIRVPKGEKEEGIRGSGVRILGTERWIVGRRDMVIWWRRGLWVGGGRWRCLI